MPSSIRRLLLAAACCCQYGLAASAGPAASSATAPPVAARADGPRCSGAPAAPGHLALQLGKSTLMRLPEPIVSRGVGNPAVLQALLVAPGTLYLVGAAVGSTNMIVQGRSGACSVIDVVVGMDTAGLQAALAALLPEEKDVRVSAAADALVLSGTVENGATLAQVLELAQAFVRAPAKALGAADKADAGASASGARIVNLLGVSAPQQVMLEVKIAEVSKTLIDKLEGAAAYRPWGGTWSGGVAANFLSGTLRGTFGLGKALDKYLRLDGESKDGLVRILAEPTVMAVSGQEGSFLAGGTIFIPVAQDNNKVTLEEKEFGVGLRFTPTVLAGGRINLAVAPEVSELSREGIGISTGSVGGKAIMPLLTTRRASTTVQLYDGQSFAIGGLIRDNQTSNIDALPVLGELPVLGALFRSTDFQRDRTELLFVVTAHLVKPLPPAHALPTDALQPASAGDLMLRGRLEAPPPAAPARSSGFQLK
ncbi:type II and III secretion system protein family protein [Pseudoduganella chitinolytica]|uniref:Type II and III secretion system protein family protein n=1 Tax=Pseudoduganella chitinolytica TaxID=34070 RepID=A0ABY8B8T0_9BURK|nr:type II and III secretion system protein family protein [Pseudoduganella chitinolytica]WEF32315.1 type II and III secretion system protein family protein [Pseudoduganella chitinolytica]